MGLADIARAKQIQKQLDRLQSAQDAEERDRHAYKFATYQGKDPVDGTDIVEVDGVKTSGFRLMSNAPLSIGDRVNLRPNQQGLQRVDAQNVAPVVDDIIAEEIEKIIYFSAGTFIGLFDTKKNKLIKKIGSVDDGSFAWDRGIVAANKNIYAMGVSSGFEIYVINATQKRIIATIPLINFQPSPSMQPMLFCPSNNKIYLTSLNNLKVISLSANEIVNTISIPDGDLLYGGYCPSNDKIYYSHVSSINSSSESVYVIDPTSNTIIDFIDISYAFYITYCPSNDRLYVSRVGLNIIVINPNTNAVIAEIPDTPDANKPEYCPLNDTIYAGNYVINPNTNTLIQTIIGLRISGIVYYPFNKKLYAADRGGNIGIVNPLTNLVTKVITVGGFPFTLAFQP